MIGKQKLLHKPKHFEKIAWKENFYTCGIDEVGRGCLAGPLVVCAAILPINTKNSLLKDSKILTEKQREDAYKWITKNCFYSISIINNQISLCKTGIDYGIDIRSKSFIITGNVITDCDEIGISLFRCNLLNISGNKIRQCGIEIQFGGENNVVYGNDIESCSVGIQGGAYGSIITKNNFKNYSEIGI